MALRNVFVARIGCAHTSACCLLAYEYRVVVTVSVKTGESQVEGPELWILDQWGTRDEGHDVYPGSCPLWEAKPYVLLDYIEVYRMITESTYHEIR